MRVDEEKRQQNPEQWLADIKAERQTLLDNRSRRQRLRDEVLAVPGMVLLSGARLGCVVDVHMTFN